jgi:hypothetical protein
MFELLPVDSSQAFGKPGRRATAERNISDMRNRRRKKLAFLAGFCNAQSFAILT